MDNALSEKIAKSPFERLFNVITNPLFIILYFGLIVALFLNFDKPISSYFFQFHLEENFRWICYINKIGMAEFYFPLFLGLALYFGRIRKNPLWQARFWFLFCALMIPTAIALFLKVNLGRARPKLFQTNDPFYGFYGFHTNADYWSFPSGHTTTLIALALGFGILFPRHFWWLFLLGFSLAITRVVLVHHFLSDILLTSYLTVMEIACLYFVLKRKSWLAPVWKNKVY